MITMYPAKVNSPPTTLDGAIDDIVTTISVVDASVLPDAPNLATIGIGDNAETILYTGKNVNDLTGVTRGFQGTAKEWGTGTRIWRVFTAYDHDTFKANIEILSSAAVTVAPTGTADDVILNAALATFGVDGGILYLSSGTYEITAPITVVLDNVSIRGMGKGVTILKLKAATAINGIIEVGGDNWTIQELTIDSDRDNAANDYFWGIGINAKDNGTIKNIHFKDFGTAAANDKENPPIRFYTGASDNWTITNCYFSDVPGFAIRSEVAVSNVLIDNCYFYHIGYCTTHLESISIFAGSHHWSISHCNQAGASPYGLVLANGTFAAPCYDICIDSCSVDGNTDGDGFRFYHTYNSRMVNISNKDGHEGIVCIAGSCYNIVIDGFTVKNGCDEAWASGGIKIEERDNKTPHDITVCNGTITDLGQTAFDHAGIYIVAAATQIGFNYTFSNIIMRETRAGAARFFKRAVMIEGNHTHILITGCLFDGMVDYGVCCFDAVVDNVIISNNFFKEIDNGSAGAIEADDGDDWQVNGNNFRTCNTPIIFDNAAVARPIIQNNNWYGCTNDDDVGTATGELLHNNIDKTGAWRAEV